jgi:hypothetical protein
MILPLINAMTLKTVRSPKMTADADTIRPGVQRSRRSAAKNGFMLVGMLTVVAAMLRMARRRSH